MNSTEQYRQCLSQGMTPCEAEQEVAEAQEYERIEREMEERESKLAHEPAVKEYMAALRIFQGEKK